jgi:hypothetical protein
VSSRMVLLAALTALVCACAGPRVPELGEGVIIRRPDTGAADLSTEERERVEERLRQVEILRVRESHDEALDIVDGLLDRNLPQDLAAKCRGLRLELRRSIHAHRPVRGRLRSDRDLYAFGDDIELTLELENLSDRRVVIPLASAGASEGFVLLRFMREEIDIQGNVRQTSEQGRLALPGKVVIPPGERRFARRTLPTSARGHDGLTVFRISGRIQPSVV